jgi:hypothetical protein
MNSETQKLIDERMAKLPAYIRTALAQIHWGEQIISIGKKNGLHIDEMGALQTETVLVLVGLVHPDQYAKNLQHELHIPKEKIDAIIMDVNEKVFKNIRQSLIDFITTENENKEEKGIETEDIFKKTGIELSAETMPIMDQPMQDNTVGIAERSILEHSGVEVEEDRPIMEQREAPDRRDILSNLENPPHMESNQFSHLIKSKLSETVINPPEKTKYEDHPTTPQAFPPGEPPKRSDPYREPI